MADNITEYTSPLDTLRPTETGIQAATMAARQVNRVYTEEAASKEQLGRQLATGISGDIKAIGQVAVDYVDYQDKSKVSTAAVSGLANIEEQAQATFKGRGKPGDPDYMPPADPNDPTVLQRFTDQHITPFLESLKQIPLGEKGRNFALAKADELAQHLSTQLHAEQANLAAEGAELRSNTTRNSAAKLVLAMPTTDNINFGIKSILEDAEISKSGSGVSPQSAAKLDLKAQSDITQLVHAAVNKAALTAADPVAAVQRLNSDFGQYLKPDEQETFLGSARSIVRARREDANAKAAEDARQAKAAAYQATTGYTKQYAQDPSKVSINDLVNNPAYAGHPDLLHEAVGVLQELRKVREQGSQVDPVTSKSNALGLIDRITSDPSDPNHITDRSAIDQAFITHQIGEPEYNFALEKLAKFEHPGQKDVDVAHKRFFTDYATVINPAPVGSTYYGNGQKARFEAEQEATRQEGFLAAKGEDPKSLYDPNSPNYFGKRVSEFAVDLRGNALNPGSSYQIAAPSIAAAAAQIKTIESGSAEGNYGSIGKATATGDKAYGAYQVMGKNVGPWTKQYYGRTLTPQEFLGNKEAQDMVFEGQFGKYMKQYGPEGAARAWYAGETGMNNLGATDVNRRLTVGGYGQEFAARYRGITVAPAGITPTEALAKYAGKKQIYVPGKGILNVPETPALSGSK